MARIVAVQGTTTYNSEPMAYREAVSTLAEMRMNGDCTPGFLYYVEIL